jgi:hypothetical protein
MIDLEEVATMTDNNNKDLKLVPEKHSYLKARLKAPVLELEEENSK